MKIKGVFINSLRVCGDLVINNISKLISKITVRKTVTGSNTPKLTKITDWTYGDATKSVYFSNGTPIETATFASSPSSLIEWNTKNGVTFSMGGPTVTIMDSKNIANTMVYNCNVSSKSSIESISPPDNVKFVVINITSWTSGESIQYLGNALENTGCVYFLINQTTTAIQIITKAKRDDSSLDKIQIYGTSDITLIPGSCARFVVPGYRYSAFRSV